MCPSATSPPSIEGTLEGGADSRRRPDPSVHGAIVGEVARPSGSLATLGTPLPPEPRVPVEAVELRLASDTAALPETPMALAPIELDRETRPSWPTLAALAVVTGLAALGLGIWAAVEQVRVEEPVAATGGVDESLAVLTDSSAERYPLRGSVNRIVLVVAADGRAALTLDGLGVPAPGTTYRAWLVAPGSATPLAAGAFDASVPVVQLTRRVASGARVAVTLEPATGAARPSRPLRLVAVRS